MKLGGLVSAWILLGSQLAPAAASAAAMDGSPANPPPVRNISYYYDGIEQSFARPTSRAFDPAVLVRRLSGHRREAANVDENDQVRLPSTWWQPRVGYRSIPVEDMMSRAEAHDGPAPGRLFIVRLKTEGVSAGFQVKDAAGARFAIKFDPLQYPELASGSDVVVSHLLWAAGYNVPANSIVYFRRADLEIGPGATYQDEARRKHDLTWEMVDRVLAKGHQEPDSSYRAVASRIIPGKPLGEWEYRGRRKDDPEDLVPHELRREVRGLWMIYAWVNDTDCSARNTFNSWITEGGRSFARHYLIDFNGTMGSASIGSMTARDGSEYLMDFGAVARAVTTLGLRTAKWESAVDPRIPGVGFFEAKVFSPEHWHPFLPNPAFDASTKRDARWGARIVAAFTDEHIRAAVKAGRYSDPHAEDYLTRTLIERRDKIAHYWLGPTAGSTSGLEK